MKPIHHLKLENSVGSRKSTQALGVLSNTEKLLITNKMTTSFSFLPCTPISYVSFYRSAKVSRSGISRSRLSRLMKKQMPQAGFSLVELMIASLIGIFIMGGALSVHISNKESFIIQDATSYTQKNARFLINRFNNKVSEAGYSGFFPSYIAKPDDINSPVADTLNNTITNSILWDITKPVYGYDNISTSSLLGITDIVSGTDVLMLKSMTDETRIISQTLNTLTLSGTAAFNTADILIATDINNAAIFQISTVDTATPNQTAVTLYTGASPAPGNTALPILSHFGNDAEVGRLQTLIYFLKPGSNDRNSLYEGKLTTSADAAPEVSLTEMIPNVENIQFIYGVDSNEDEIIDTYQDAATITSNNEWNKVTSVGVALLISSDSANVDINNNSYTFDASTFSFNRETTGDKRYRRPYTTYITLKNI